MVSCEAHIRRHVLCPTNLPVVSVRGRLSKAAASNALTIEVNMLTHDRETSCLHIVFASWLQLLTHQTSILKERSAKKGRILTFSPSNHSIVPTPDSIPACQTRVLSISRSKSGSIASSSSCRCKLLLLPPSQWELQKSTQHLPRVTSVTGGVRLCRIAEPSGLGARDPSSRPAATHLRAWMRGSPRGFHGGETARPAFMSPAGPGYTMPLR